MFIDPLGQYTFEIPLEWSYNIQKSHLTTIVFTHWNRPGETVSVKVIPTFASGKSDAEWYRIAKLKAFPEDMKDISRIYCGGTISLFSRINGSGREQKKWVLVRGTHLDVFIRHHAPESFESTGMSQVMSTICRTLQVPTDMFSPEFFRQDIISRHLQAAKAAFSEEDLDKVKSEASQALPFARSSYLFDIAKNTPVPQIPAVIHVIKSLAYWGFAMADVFILRDAEYLIHRTHHTLSKIHQLEPDAIQLIQKDLDEQLEIVTSGQIAILQSTLKKKLSSNTLLARVEGLLDLAAIEGEYGNYELALKDCRIAVEDLLNEFANIRAHERAENTQKEKIYRHQKKKVVMDNLPHTLKMLSAIQSYKGEMENALETSLLLVEITKEIDSQEQTGPDTHRQLASALLNLAENHARFETGQDLERATRAINEAQDILDEINEGGALRAKQRLLSAVVTQYISGGQTTWEKLMKEVISKKVSARTLQTLATWALGEEPPLPWKQRKEVHLPEDVLTAGAIITYGKKHFPESDATRFWQATAHDAPPGSTSVTRHIIKKWIDSLDWRQGWAIAALRALDLTSPFYSPGLLSGIEFLRAILVDPSTIINCRLNHLQAESRNLDRDSIFAESPTLEESPFGDSIVREVLLALDYLVAAQETDPARLRNVLVDMEQSSVRELRKAREEMKAFPGRIFNQSAFSRGVGSAVSTILRAVSGEAEDVQNYNKVDELNNVFILAAARYGYTSDFLLAVDRACSTTARINLEAKNMEMMVQILEHIKIAAIWLDDDSVEAAIQHGLGLVLRSGVRKFPGLLDAISAFERAITLRDRLGENISSLGSQIDLASIFIQGNNMFSCMDEAPVEAKEWDKFSEIYLTDAIERLTRLEKNPTVLNYIGEAFHNRARLYQLLNKNKEAADDALASLSFAVTTGNRGMKARAHDILSRVAEYPEERIKNSKSAADLVQDIRNDLTSEYSAVTWLLNKDAVFDTQLSSLLKESGRSIDEQKACELMIEALETSRGLTYNRWLGSRPVTAKQIIKALADDEINPVLAIFVSTTNQVALIVIDGEHIQLFHLEMTNRDLEDMVEEHMSGLNQQGDVPGSSIWNQLQKEFVEKGYRLVEPLEPYVNEERTICIVPHRALQGAALHTLPTSPGGQPIGLRAPVFQNPSLTNWIVARSSGKEPANNAFVGLTGPQDELANFTDAEIAAQLLADSGLEVINPAPSLVDIQALSTKDVRWQVLHLASHGIFEAPRPEIGLLLSRNGQLPPSPYSEINDEVKIHLASPDDLRKAGASGRLTFLASCLSSRNEEYPGDDLMGVTRAFFASGTADMIAGGWTVVSYVAEVFADHFYQALLSNHTTAQAVFEARKAVAITYPDPFYWGMFIHQGANTCLSKEGIRNAK